jgi:magnesium transporter
VVAALWLNAILALCLGGSLPLLLKRMTLDPAIAAGPILTSATDLMGVLIVLTLAQRFLTCL